MSILFMNKLQHGFYKRDVLTVAPELLGKYMVRKFDDGNVIRLKITETEAYRGEEDMACHARAGKTERTKIMYGRAGHLYIYLIYGMYYMLNIITGEEDEPQGVLIRGIEGINGPGRLTKALNIDRSFYGEDLTNSSRIWIEDNGPVKNYEISKRINVDYAGEWAEKPWRFFIKV